MEITIATILGVLIGGGILWLFYIRPLETRLKTAVSTKSTLYKKADSLTNKVASLNSEHQRDQSSLAAAEIEISQLQNQLKRESNHTDRLETENDTLHQQMAAVSNRNKQLQESLKTAYQETVLLKNEKQNINKQLTLTKIEHERMEERRVGRQEVAVILHTRGLAYHLQNNQEQLQALKTQVTDIHQHLIESADIRHQLQQTEEKLNEAERELATLYRNSDPLRQINGIGPVYAERLHKADIHTIPDLAALTSAVLETKIGVLEVAQTDSWITQAKEMINTKQGRPAGSSNAGSPTLIYD